MMNATSKIGSANDTWLMASSAPPVRGRCSPPRQPIRVPNMANGQISGDGHAEPEARVAPASGAGQPELLPRAQRPVTGHLSSSDIGRILPGLRTVAARDHAGRETIVPRYRARPAPNCDFGPSRHPRPGTRTNTRPTTSHLPVRFQPCPTPHSPASNRSAHAPAAPDSVVLVLHGGRSHSHEPGDRARLTYLRMRADRPDAAPRPTGPAVFLLRYRYRGWNGPARDALRDAAWALDELDRRFPGRTGRAGRALDGRAGRAGRRRRAERGRGLRAGPVAGRRRTRCSSSTAARC